MGTLQESFSGLNFAGLEQSPRSRIIFFFQNSDPTVILGIALAILKSPK